MGYVDWLDKGGDWAFVWFAQGVPPSQPFALLEVADPAGGPSLPSQQDFFFSSFAPHQAACGIFSSLTRDRTRACNSESAEPLTTGLPGDSQQDFLRCQNLLLLLWGHFSRVRVCVALWTAASRAPLSMGFSRQEYLLRYRNLKKHVSYTPSTLRFSSYGSQSLPFR